MPMLPEPFELNGHSYQAYVDVPMADNYLFIDITRKAAWEGLRDDVDDMGAVTVSAEAKKQRLLVAATWRLNLLRYKGEKAESGQENEWPRVNVPDHTDGDIPFALKHATSILAAAFITTPAFANAAAQVSNIKKAKAGSGDVEFFRPLANAPLQDNTALLLLRNAGLLEGGDVPRPYVGGLDVAPFPLGDLSLSDVDVANTIQPVIIVDG